MLQRTAFHQTDLILAMSIREAMMNSDLRDSLRNAIQAAHSGVGGHDGHWHSYVDHSGDEDSGDVIYTCDPDNDGDCDYMSAPYSKGSDTSDDAHTVDLSQAHQVAMRHAWEPVADDADGYAAMQESALYSKGEVPMCERFVSKKERAAAPSSSFAGKGKSFPILKAADVAAAAASLGRAGSNNYSTDVIKRNIIRIAKEKGWTSSLPKSWQDGGDDSKKESAAVASVDGALRCVESAAWSESIRVQEAAGAKSDYEIKLISPGPGAMAEYPADVLRRDGPAAFPANTKIYLNHPFTEAEMKQSPGNRDVTRFAGVTTTPAQWKESHPQGPGLYARMKVFSDHAQALQEKAPHLGMSVILHGKQLMEGSKRVVRNGLPVLGSIDVGESVDIVSKAGAGGLILSEAAKPGNSTQEGGMSPDEVKRLVEAELRAARLPGEAEREANRLLVNLSFTPEQKQYVAESVCSRSIPTKDGALDTEEFGKMVLAEAQRYGRSLPPGRITGMGIAPVQAALKPEEIAAREAASKAEKEDMIKVYESMGMPHSAAVFAAEGRVQ